MQNLEYIDDYFRGTLSPEALKAFEQRVETDNDFAEEVAFYASTLQVMRQQLEEERKNRFRELYEQHKTVAGKKTVIRKLWPYLAAAAVIAALFIGISLFSNRPSLEQMADDYINTELKSMNVKMAAHKDSIDIGRNLYNEGKLPASLEQFKKLAQADSSATNIQIYAGIVSLRLQQYDSAIAYFKQAENNTGDYANRGKFLHALTLLKRNGPHDRQEAHSLLQEVVAKNLEAKEIAEKWLKQF